MAKTTEEIKEYRRKWRLKHRDRLNKEAKEKNKKFPELLKKIWDNHQFGGHKQRVLERDNFECQDCGMTQEKHFVLFNTQLVVHHKDGKGRRSEEKNNDIKNLITMCIRCHAKVHREIEMKKRYGELMDQDNSIWAFPKLRKLVQLEISYGNKVGKSKKIVAKNTGLGYGTIDHRYYERKNNPKSKIQRRLTETKRGKK